jgi:hypothetical protein
MTPFFAVLRVVNVLPQAQWTVVSPYAGWMPGFMVLLMSWRRVVPRAHVNRTGGSDRRARAVLDSAIRGRYQPNRRSGPRIPSR